MCQFNYITLASSADVPAIRDIARKFGKNLGVVSAHALLTFLRAGEKLYATTTVGCDCGSCVGCGRLAPDASEDTLEREARKLAAKGWSEAKIARWRAGKAAMSRREARLRHERLEDRMSEARTWCDFIRSVPLSATPWIGLIHTWEGGGNSELKREFKETSAKLDHLEELAILELPRFQLCRFVQ